jgi:two-component system, LuxR family, sensor kinase FixL
VSPAPGPQFPPSPGRTSCCLSLAPLASIAPLSTPSTQLLFFISIITVVVVTVFACTVVVLLLRRRHTRNLHENRMAVIGTTTARILHQIKNPVQSLLLQAELLEEFERNGKAELRRESARAICGEALRLAAMLSELSAWTAGSRRPLTLVPTPLHELVEQIVQQEQQVAATRGIRVESAIAAEGVVAIDPYYFRQALENLMRNAREALVDQEDALLRIELDRAGPDAVLRVVDNGPGIAPDRLTEVFEPFATTKGSGMGLGLPISREIIEKHGGTIRVHSAPGEGATFTVQLPVYQEGRTSRKQAWENNPDRAPRNLRAGNHPL